MTKLRAFWRACLRKYLQYHPVSVQETKDRQRSRDTLQGLCMELGAEPDDKGKDYSNSSRARKQGAYDVDGIAPRKCNQIPTIGNISFPF